MNKATSNLEHLEVFEVGVIALNLKIDLWNSYKKVFGVRDIKSNLPDEDSKFQLAYVEPGMKLAWVQEDEDYARQCADEKWRSRC